MRFTLNWIPYLHNTREKEIKIIFSKCPKKLFENGLELGAGDGYQSKLLTQYVINLVSTDINPEILEKEDTRNIRYLRIDAEELDNAFKEKEFDLIFSSNLFEHLFNPKEVLDSVNKILKDNGIIIHIIPNPFYKICKLSLNPLYNFLLILEALIKKNGFKKLIKGPSDFIKKDKIEMYHNVNPKLRRQSKPYLYRFFIPEPHGISPNNIAEIFAFSRYKWKKEFKKANFKIVKILNGPLSTGYGFKFIKLKKILEKIGISFEYIYIAVKKGKESPYKDFF